MTMSRKTSEIKKSIKRINQLNLLLAENCKDLPEELCRKNKIILEEMQTELKNLDLWFSMIYKYNGKSRTRLKVAASRENGKKGGRPPKIITDLKAKKAQKESELEEIHAQKLAVFDPEKESELSEKEKNCLCEIEEIEDKIEKLMLTRVTKNEDTL